MLDIKFLKSNQEVVKNNLNKRNQPEKIKWVDEIIKELEDLRAANSELLEALEKACTCHLRIAICNPCKTIDKLRGEK
ncbi:MAG: hypothetical protein AABY22_12655 [Nanoarchaeota archaeon]